MKIQKENRCRVLKTNDYTTFRHNAKRISKARLNLLLEEMQIKNLSKDLPIIVDENFNILDGKYRFEANKKLNEPIYYKCAEIGNYIDFMKAANLQYKPTFKDFAIHHSDKLSYRKVLDYSNKLPFSFKDFMYEICNLHHRSHLEMRKFKDGFFDFTIQMEYLAKEAVKIVEYIYNELSEMIIITDISEILYGSDYTLSGFKKIIDKNRDIILKYVELLQIGYPLSQIYPTDRRIGRTSTIDSFADLFSDILNNDSNSDDWYNDHKEDYTQDNGRFGSYLVEGYDCYPNAKKIVEIYNTVFQTI